MNIYANDPAIVTRVINNNVFSPDCKTNRWYTNLVKHEQLKTPINTPK